MFCAREEPFRRVISLAAVFVYGEFQVVYVAVVGEAEEVPGHTNDFLVCSSCRDVHATLFFGEHIKYVLLASLFFGDFSPHEPQCGFGAF